MAESLRSLKAKVNNGIKDLSDSISSKTQGLKKDRSSRPVSSLGSPFRKISDTFHMGIRKSTISSGGGTPIDKIKSFKDSIMNKAKGGAKSSSSKTSDGPSFGARPTSTINENPKLEDDSEISNRKSRVSTNLRGESYLDEIESEK